MLGPRSSAAVLLLCLGIAAVAAQVVGVAPQACDAPGREACSSAVLGAYEGEYFPDVGKILYEGATSTNPLAFKYYNSTEVVLGKPMREWLRFSVAFWHTMRATGADPFGTATHLDDELELSFRRLRAFFELLDKLGVDYWAFHDRDIAPEGRTLADTNAMLDQVVALAKELQQVQGVKLLWGTAQLFKHPRYVHGAATSANATVFAYAAAQVKKALEVTQELGGANYVFWGGREGYATLLNTDMRLELENQARFLRMAVAHKRRIGFKGALLLEPKPQEPMKHQYDFDAATTAAFLLKHGLEKDFKLNIECNHATLAGHSCQHELETAAAYGLLGSVDANTGDPQVGWDTDQFLTCPREAILLMSTLVEEEGLAPGGLNFDAKVRRESTSPTDLFYAHISGMDAMARGLRNAARMAEEGVLSGMREARYSSYRDSKLGRDIVKEKVGFAELEKHALGAPDPWEEGLPSGSAELYDVWLSRYVR